MYANFIPQVPPYFARGEKRMQEGGFLHIHKLFFQLLADCRKGFLRSRLGCLNHGQLRFLLVWFPEDLTGFMGFDSKRAGCVTVVSRAIISLKFMGVFCCLVFSAGVSA